MRGPGKKKVVIEKQKDGWKVCLSQGYVTFVSDQDIEWVKDRKWYVVITKGRPYVKGYMWVDGKQKNVYLHREILGLTNPKIMVDHIDGDGLNNRRANLRGASHVENCWNKVTAKRGVSGVRGVYPTRSGWQSLITVNGEQMYLGHFSSVEEARKVRLTAEKKFFGEFAPID